MQKRRISHITVIVTVIFVAAAALAFAAALHRSTFVEWWRLPLFCLLPAAACGYLARNVIGRFCAIRHGALNALIGFLLSMPLLLAAFYALNYYNSDSSTATSVRAEIAGKHTEQRYRSRRVGRNRYVRGDSYQEYFVDIMLPDSTIRSQRVAVGEYVGLRRGAHATIHLEQGMLGFQVIKNIKLHKYTKKQ